MKRQKYAQDFAQVAMALTQKRNETNGNILRRQADI